MPKVSGTLYRQGSKERIEFASVKAVKGTTILHTTSNGDGDFEITLEPGKWTLVALDESSRPCREEVDLATDDKPGLRLYLLRAQDTEDAKLGRRTWLALLIALGVLIALYITLHALFPRPPSPLAAGLPALIDQAQAQAGTAQPGGSAELRATIAQVESTLAALTKGGGLGDADQVVAGLAEALRAALDQDRLPDLLAGLATLEQLVLPASRASAGIWDQGVWRFLEVILWGLAGVLVNKIITIAWWLRSARFYREGIVMHIAHILTTPLLVLVAVLLLSLATLSITLAGGNQLTIDLSDPRILAAVSFLLGSSPWPLWDFIEGTAKRITGRVE